MFDSGFVSHWRARYATWDRKGGLAPFGRFLSHACPVVLQVVTFGSLEVHPLQSALLVLVPGPRLAEVVCLRHVHRRRPSAMLCPDKEVLQR